MTKILKSPIFYILVALVLLTLTHNITCDVHIERKYEDTDERK